MRSTKSLEKGEAGDKVAQRESGESSNGTFTRLIAMCRPEWKYGIGGIVGSILAGCQNPVLGFLIGEVLAAYYSTDTEMKRDVGKYAIALVCIGVSAFLIFVLQHYSLGVVGENLVKRVRVRMFDSKYSAHRLGLSFAEFVSAHLHFFLFEFSP